MSWHFHAFSGHVSVTVHLRKLVPFVVIMALASASAMFPPSNLSYKAWEDPSFFKWRKREAHVPLRSQDTLEGRIQVSLSVAELILQG
jgi:hypothetical protein